MNDQFVCYFFTQLGTLVDVEYSFVDKNGWFVQLGEQEQKLTVLDLIENRSLQLVSKGSSKM